MKKAGKHVVCFSGGVGSWATAKIVAKRVGLRNLVLLFTDTLIEDEDLYRFLVEAAANVFKIKDRRSINALAQLFLHIPPIDEMAQRKRVLFMLREQVLREIPGLVWLVEGRSVWEIYRDERLIGNSRFDPCSKILKRKMLDRYVEQYEPDEVIVYVGLDWTEEHRFEGQGEKLGLRLRKLPYIYKAPLCEPPYYMKQMLMKALERQGIDLPRLYRMGFAHNNCGGFCCKAGQGQFVQLYRQLPERYAYHERKESYTQAVIGHPYTVLRRQVKGEIEALSLKTLREEIEAGVRHDKYDIGGCGCMMDED